MRIVFLLITLTGLLLGGRTAASPPSRLSQAERAHRVELRREHPARASGP